MDSDRRMSSDRAGPAASERLAAWWGRGVRGYRSSRRATGEPAYSSSSTSISHKQTLQGLSLPYA